MPLAVKPGGVKPGYISATVAFLLWFTSTIRSVAQSCPTLCDPMNRSTPGLPVTHKLPEFTQTHVHRVIDGHPAISSSVVPFFSCPQSLPASESFPMSQLFPLCGQSIGAPASASVLPIQCWFTLGLTGLISWLSNGLSRVFSSTTIWKHQFFGTQPFFMVQL